MFPNIRTGDKVVIVPGGRDGRRYIMHVGKVSAKSFKLQAGGQTVCRETGRVGGYGGPGEYAEPLTLERLREVRRQRQEERAERQLSRLAVQLHMTNWKRLPLGTLLEVCRVLGQVPRYRTPRFNDYALTPDPRSEP